VLRWGRVTRARSDRCSINPPKINGVKWGSSVSVEEDPCLGSEKRERKKNREMCLDKTHLSEGNGQKKKLRGGGGDGRQQVLVIKLPFQINGSSISSKKSGGGEKKKRTRIPLCRRGGPRKILDLVVQHGEQKSGEKKEGVSTGGFVLPENGGWGGEVEDGRNSRRGENAPGVRGTKRGGSRE